MPIDPKEEKCEVCGRLKRPMTVDALNAIMAGALDYCLNSGTDNCKALGYERLLKERQPAAGPPESALPSVDPEALLLEMVEAVEGESHGDGCAAYSMMQFDASKCDCFKATAAKARAALARRAAPTGQQEAGALRAAKDAAYAERNQCVALIAKMALVLGWRAGVRDHEGKPGETWEPDWRNLVCIDLPTGQVTWHFHDSERLLLTGMPAYPAPWDGHDTAEKYRRVNDWLPRAAPPSAPQEGLELIAKERKRQIEKEGWTPDHDDEHEGEELARAAACYALPAHYRQVAGPIAGVPLLWPWAVRWWKPSPDRVRELSKAGALIAAEIDRLSRRALPLPKP
jgi:hypothetical protein